MNSSISVLRSLVFQIVRKFHWWSVYLRMLGKGLQLKATALLVFFLWFEKLVNDRIVDHLGTCSLFSDFNQKKDYMFLGDQQFLTTLSFQSTVDLLTKASDRIAKAFTGLVLFELLHLTYSRLLTGFGMLDFFTCKSYGISGQTFDLISFLSNRRL